MRHDMDRIDCNVIKRAQAGGKEARALLVKQVAPKVCTYIYRMTLDDHVCDDLSQETLMELVKSLPKLKFQHVNLFWAWLYRTALSKVQRHYRVQGNKRLNIKSVGDKDDILQRSDRARSGVQRLMHNELCQAALQAMSALQLRYRSVLTLRCFEELSYPEIASVMGISEAQARLCFFRAKRLLKRHLNRRGFKKDDLMSALGAFGFVTLKGSQTAKAVPKIAAGSLEVGLLTAVVGTLTTKVTMIAVGFVLAAAGTVSIVASRYPETSSMTTQTTVPVPRQDLTLYNIWDDPMEANKYGRIRQVISSHDPDNNGWPCFIWWPRISPVRMLSSPMNRPAGETMLVVSKDHWLHYELPASIKNHSGPEIAIQIWNLGTLPHFYLTNGILEHRIYPTSYRGAYPAGGHMIIGFDLNPVDIPFEAKSVRILGRDNAGQFGGCGVGSIKASLESAR